MLVETAQLAITNVNKFVSSRTALAGARKLNESMLVIEFLFFVLFVQQVFFDDLLHDNARRLNCHLFRFLLVSLVLVAVLRRVKVALVVGIALVGVFVVFHAVIVVIIFFMVILFGILAVVTALPM